ncbi:MAG TPA: PAS domain-containing sensor histidine kinase, partial [Candidatus Competibacteraceae bacterium]|nr:PAS domain-containing sensor histidine kinase [Candidatus Competibacteraceae bacterium]
LDPPFIVIADSVIPMEQVTALMPVGVHAIVYSDNLATLAPAVERELQQAQARRQARETARQSEHRYRLIFDTVPVSIWESDLITVKAAIDKLKAKGVSDFRRYLEKANPAFIRWAAGQIKVLNVNTTTLTLYGARDKEELQKALDQVLVSQTYALFRDLLIAIAQGETFFKGETICRTLKGKLLHVIVSLAIPVEPSGFKNIAICVVDITAHRHTEEALARSQQNFQNVVVKNQSGIVITDHQGTVLFSNPAAQLLLGRSAQELVGEHLGLPVVAHHIAEIDIIRPGQGIGVAEMSVTQTEWEGQPAYLAMLNDVTERTRAEDERNRAERIIIYYKGILEEMIRERTAELMIAKEAAEAANRAKSTFLANMSHELRTPLHSILSFARLGIKKNTIAPPEKRLHYFEKIADSGETLLVLLNDLLDLAKLESGKNSFDFRAADLGMLIYRIIDEFRPLAAERQIDIRFERPSQRLQVMLDKLKITQVIRNLLSNAVKFSPEGGMIDVILQERENTARVTLCDQGIGIPDNELQAVFDEFIQSSKTKTGAGGTGLGLAISRQIIHGHRGRIWAENN